MKAIINGSCIVCGSKNIVQECFYKHSDTNLSGPTSQCQSESQYRCERHKVTDDDLKDSNSLFKEIKRL